MFTRTLLAIPAVLLLAACGGGDGATGPGENPGAEGSFTGTISGGLSKSVTGTAVFGTSQADGGFVLALGDDEDGFLFGRELDGAPGVGTHAVYDLAGAEEEEVPANAISGVFGLDVGGVSYLCSTSGGTLTVAVSTATRFEGSVNVTAVCTAGLAGTNRTITLAGPFRAVGGDVD